MMMTFDTKGRRRTEPKEHKMPTASVTVEVDNHSIPIRSVFLVVDDPHAKVIYIDCKAKRPVACPLTSILFGDDPAEVLEVHLSADNETININKTDPAPTVVSIIGLSVGDWFIETSVVKHLVYLFLWDGARLLNPPITTLWSAGEG